MEHRSIFFEIVQNSVRYALKLNSYYIPTNGNASTIGYTKPSGAAWSYPITNQTPQAQTYPSTIQSTNQSIVSTQTPVISSVNSYVLTYNLLNSRYSIPSNTFLVSL